MIPVSLCELVDEMQTLSIDIHGYVNRVTGKIVIIMDEHIRDVENEADYSNRQKWEQKAFEDTKEVLESEDYLELPSQFEIHEYAIMENFCISYPNEAMNEGLLDLIRGSGAFRRFKTIWSGTGSSKIGILIVTMPIKKLLSNGWKKMALPIQMI